MGGLLAEAATLKVPDGHSMVTVVGASCGIYAILLTGLAYVLINYRETRYANYIVALYFALIFIEVTTSIVNPVANVSYVGHAFGAVYGVATGIFVVPNLHKLPWERSLRLVCWAPPPSRQPQRGTAASYHGRLGVITRWGDKVRVEG